MGKTEKRKLKKGYRALRGLYRLLVAISAVVVALYVAYRVAVRPPEVPSNPEPTNKNSATEQLDSQEQVPVGEARKEQYYTFLLAASDQGNGNADTIMVMSFDVPNQKIGIVSIPRDTLVKKRMPKINATYKKGVDNLRETVSDLVGFPIDFYITVDMKAFKAIVDAVDGVDFNVPINMYWDDPTQNLHIHFNRGMQHLSGTNALKVARFRKNNDGTGYPDSDIGRTRTQHALLQAMAKKVLSWSSITKVNAFLDIFAKYVETDLPMNNLVYFAEKASDINLKEDISSTTLPGDGDVTYKGVKWCYQLHIDETIEILNELVNPYTKDLSKEDVNIFQFR